MFQKFRTVQVGEHTLSIPDTPKGALTIPSAFGGETTIPLDDLIIYRKESREGAYWRRDPSIDRFFFFYNPDPEEGTVLFAEETAWNGNQLLSLNHADSKRLLYLFDRENFRRRYGVHFKNGGEVVYLTGDHYFILEYVKMYAVDEEYCVDRFYGRYLEYQRDFAYVMRHAIGDKNILGVFCGKPKKTGITQFMAGYYINKSTLYREKQMGIMSKGLDAADVNMLYYFHGFDGLPMIFKPTIRNRADQTGEIIFGEPPVRNTRTKAGQKRLAQLQDVEPLNNRVWAAKTKEAGFDSPKMADIWFDELPKYDTENKQDVERVFMRNQETVKMQTRITGKIWVTSYPPETDTKGFRDARKIYYDSKLATAKSNPLGRTKSGLICHYISALNSHIDAFDRYGRCDVQKAKYLNSIERDANKHDKKLYQAKIRQYSETEKECWSSAGAGSTFDNIRLGEILFEIEEELKAHRPYVDGRLEWDNTLWESGARDRRPLKQFTSVRFVPLTVEELERGETGRLRLYLPLSKKEQCRALRAGRDSKGNLLRLGDFRHYGGVDPTEYAKGSEVNVGSRNASYTKSFRDAALDAAYGRVVSGLEVAEYYYRPENPLEFYEDLVKEIIYFGKVVWVEANKKWVATKLIEDGLGHYMVVRQRSTGLYVFWSLKLERDKDYTLISTDENLHDDMVRAIKKWLMKPADGEFDYAGACRLDRLVQQLMDFDPARWKFADLVVGKGLTELLGEVLTSVPVAAEDDLYSAEQVAQVWGLVAG